MGTGQYSKAIRETAENLRIIDDAMFRLVAERKEVCQEILRTLLDRPQLKVVSVTVCYHEFTQRDYSGCTLYSGKRNIYEH